MSNPLAVLAVTNTNCTDGAIERNATDHQGSRSSVDAEHVVRVDLIGTQDGEHDLNFVTEAIGERWAQRTVGETAGQNCCFARTTFAAEECTWNFASGIGTFFNVNGEWEKVNARTDIFGGVCSGEHNAVPNTGNNSSLALKSQFSCFKRQGLIGSPNGTRHSDGVGHGELLSRNLGSLPDCIWSSGSAPSRLSRHLGDGHGD